MATDVRSVPGICDVERILGADADPRAAPDLLIEVPHGATTAQDYARVRGSLQGELPDDLQDFFFVNTDVGAPECARWIARRYVGTDGGDAGDPTTTRTARQAWIVRCRVPRTFIDCNRVVGTADGDLHEAGLTQAVPGYITDDADRQRLVGMHREYTDVAERAFAAVCGNGGLGLIVHTYAPKAVGIVDIDAGIVEALHRAYEPAQYATWPDRPVVDLITETTEGESCAPRAIADRLRAAYALIGIDATENVSYKLHPGTMALQHCRRYPDRVLCLELSRGELADPFTPFEEMRISGSRVARMSRPIVEALGG